MLLPVEIARFNRPQRRLVSVALILASRRTAVSCYGALRSPDFPPADCSADDRLEKFRSQGMHFTRFIAAFQARTDFHPHRPLPRNFDYPLAITIGFIYIFVHLPRSPAKQGCKRHNDINPTSQSSLLEKRHHRPSCRCRSARPHLSRLSEPASRRLFWHFVKLRADVLL